MRAKKFMTSMAYAPATVLSSLISLVLRFIKSTPSNKGNDNEAKSNKKQNPGLLGLIFHFISYIGYVTLRFIMNHKKAISLAFWSSLFLGGITALTVFFWPATLTTIAACSIYGFSIASVAGPDLFLQVAVVGILAFSATWVTAYFAAAIDACFKKNSNTDDPHNKIQINHPNTSRNTAKNHVENTSPVHTASLFKKQRCDKEFYELETSLTCNLKH